MSRTSPKSSVRQSLICRGYLTPAARIEKLARLPWIKIPRVVTLSLRFTLRRRRLGRLARLCSRLESWTLSISPVQKDKVRPMHRVTDWRRPWRLISLCPRSVTLSAPWLTAPANISLIEHLSWPDCCKIRSEATPRLWWLQHCRLPTITLMRHCQRWDTLVVPRTLKTSQLSMKIQRTPF